MAPLYIIIMVRYTSLACRRPLAGHGIETLQQVKIWKLSMTIHVLFVVLLIHVADITVHVM